MNVCRGRTQNVCLVSMLFAAASWAQLLSIPIDPDKASLEVGRRKPDGSQFVLNVRVEGSPPIRYVALREEAARREADELANLRTLVDTEKQRSEGLRKEVEAKTGRVLLLEQSKTELMDELFKAQVASKRARKRVKSAPDAGAEPSGASVGAAAEKASTPPATPTATSAPSEEQSKPNSAANPPPVNAANADAALDRLPAAPGLLTLPIPDNAKLQITRTTPDGSELLLHVTMGGVVLRYVASREDAVARTVEQFELLTADRDALQARNRELQLQGQQLGAKADLLADDVTDIKRGVALAKQNLAQLEIIIQAQRTPWWQVLIEVLPTIASIAALAVK